MDIKKQIAELVKQGFSKSQAGIIAMSKNKMMQEGGEFNYNKTGNVNIEQRDLARINEGTGINFTPEFSQSYFSTQSTPPPAQKQAVDYSTYPIVDITSDGQFTNRKVWRTQRPEWFVGKQEPVEGKDYTTVPYSQWKTYQNSPEYSTYTNRGQIASRQLGGMFSGYRMDVPNQIDYNFQGDNLNPIQGYQPTDYSSNFIQNNPLPIYSSNGLQVNPNVVDQNNMPSSILNNQTVNPLSSKQPQFSNIFGGDNISLGLRTLGAGIGEKDATKIGMGAGLTTISGARSFLGGLGTGRENRRADEEYRNDLLKDNRTVSMLQQGGEIKNSDILTGKFAVENPNGGNVNIERGEFIKNNTDGNIQKAVGEDHKNGGINIEATDSKVLSDFTKIGAKNAKELKDRYNLSIKKTDTFAKVMDKVNKKIGVDEAIEEQAKAIEDLGKNEVVKDATTKRLNEKTLAKEVQEYEQKLESLKGAQNFVFEDIFARQEQIPKKGNGELINEDGSKMEVNETSVMQQGGHIQDLASKYGISSERAQELIMMQEGGQIQTPQNEVSQEQIVQAFAEATQQDPNEIIQQLQQLSTEEQQQAVSQMMQQLQAPQEQATQDGVPQEQMMQEGGKIYAQEGYSFSTRYLPKSDGYVTDGSSILNQDTLTGVEEFQTYTGKGYGAKMEDANKTISTHPWYFDTEAKKKAFTEATTKKGRQPEVVAFQEAYNNELEKRANAVGLPKTEIENIKKQVGFAKEGVQKVDGLFGAFTSTRPLYNFSKKDGAVNVTPSTTPEFNYGATEEGQAPTISPDNTSGFQPYITPPSPRQNIILETAQAPQYDRVKRTFEPSQAALANQLDTRREQLAASGLSPMQQEALFANESANAQNSANDNIAKVEQFNAANQQDISNKQADANFKTGLFNTSQRDQFFTRNVAAKDNEELARKQYNDAYNKLGYRTQEDARSLATLNSTFTDMRINRDGSITYVPHATTSTPDNSEYDAWYAKLTAPEQEIERKRRVVETLARVNAQKKQNALKNNRKS